MAAPTNFTYTPGHDLFGDFQFGFSRQAYTPSSPQTHSAICSPNTETFNEKLHVTSPCRTKTEITNNTQPPRMPSCPSCRGKRYDYTCYFHNIRIFARPPHEFLRLIEESYILKNRLQSLLINYVLRDAKDEDPAQIRKDLEIWEANVNNLAVSLGDNESLEQLRSWSNGIMRQVWEHLAGEQKMEMPSGKARQLASEFRRLWETVWIRCVEMKGDVLVDGIEGSS